jgi:hypothetical protein
MARTAQIGFCYAPANLSGLHEFTQKLGLDSHRDTATQRKHLLKYSIIIMVYH